MQREFTRYYELSADRKALVSLIAESESAIAARKRASASLHALEASA
jgi:hypothetical protein